MSHRVVYVDAFTTRPFEGNPCAVVLAAEDLSEEQMLAIARETNQPETSFVSRSKEADFRVAYFTPRQRIPFAGHPTIATAFLLALEGDIRPAGAPGQPAVVKFQFDIGVLPVEVHFASDGRPQRAVMTQAAPVFSARVPAAEAAPGLGLAEVDLLPGVTPQVVSTGVPFLMVPARDLEVLKKARMDRPRLAALLAGLKAPAAFLFCLRGFDPAADTHARFLDPSGAMEDPFTGSAAGAMGAYLVRYGLKSGPLLHIEQGHLLGRPGQGQLEVRGSGQNIQGIKLGGSAVKTLEGTIL
jgi:trans-2,3-dihydro-3-hydroxyanthranilate isomerase